MPPSSGAGSHLVRPATGAPVLSELVVYRLTLRGWDRGAGSPGASRTAEEHCGLLLGERDVVAVGTSGREPEESPDHVTPWTLKQPLPNVDLGCSWLAIGLSTGGRGDWSRHALQVNPAVNLLPTGFWRAQPLRLLAEERGVERAGFVFRNGHGLSQVEVPEGAAPIASMKERGTIPVTCDALGRWPTACVRSRLALQTRLCRRRRHRIRRPVVKPTRRSSGIRRLCSSSSGL
jgi:hypothetical protein